MESSTVLEKRNQDVDKKYTTYREIHLIVLSHWRQWEQLEGNNFQIYFQYLCTTRKRNANYLHGISTDNFSSIFLGNIQRQFRFSSSSSTNNNNHRNTFENHGSHEVAISQQTTKQMTSAKRNTWTIFLFILLLFSVFF